MNFQFEVGERNDPRIKLAGKTMITEIKLNGAAGRWCPAWLEVLMAIESHLMLAMGLLFLLDRKNICIFINIYIHYM